LGGVGDSPTAPPSIKNKLSIALTLYMMTIIEERARKVVEDFAMFSDWMEKYEYIIDMGKNVEGLPDNLKNDKTLIKGCQSRVWLVSECKNGKMVFRADSDALITRGLISLLLEVCNNLPPEEIFNYDFHFIKEIGLEEHLSPTRSNGLLAMIKRIKEDAYMCMKNKQK